ncbi:unnamed protein product [Orchesella dallaii]|uniref:Uncharacterized protein n=1 Tax=Orchesella dallaii TaxID=48710 RepID=A0ABP1QKH4_9HEXA
MNRVHPKELLGMLPEDFHKHTEPDQADEDLDPATISEFSWKMAIKYLDKRLVNQLGRSEMYFLDGRPINDDSFLEGMTRELCQEYSLLLLDVIADLILPIGFKYPTLLTSLHELVIDGFKPVSSITQRKTVVWVDDIHWNNPKYSIVERFLFELLMKNAEPFLVAPKYFDQEALSMLSGKLVTGQPLTGTTTGDSDEMKRKSWDAFSILLRFGFMLLLRASNCSLIVLHVNQKIAEIIDAFALLDLAESEGHCVMNLKNTATTPEERNGIVMSFVEKVLNTPPVQNQISTSSSRLPTAVSSSSSSELSSLSSRAASDDMADDNDHLLEKMSLDDFALSDSEEEDSFEDSNFAV